MKKSVLLLTFFISLVLFANLVFAANQTVKESAIDCLEDKVEGECDSLTTEQKAFSLLSIGECKDELIADSNNEECWPESCNLRLTALSAFALNKQGENTSKTKEWLLSQTKTPENLEWFLEIDSNSETLSCKINYNNNSHSISIDENKKINQDAGNCLSLSTEDYWLEINSNCYDTEFEISCNESFLTTLLFKKQDSSTIHVLEDVHSSSAEGETTEKVKALCFSQGTTCDYRGSLWATLVLDYLGEDVSEFLPYLIIGKEETENQRYLPESFLYFLTGEFNSELLQKQSGDGFWSVSGNKYYDTSLALFPFISESLSQKDKAKSWLKERQGEEGCWNSQDIRDTAFVLYSIYGGDTGGDDGEEPGVPDCESEAEGYCITSLKCNEAGGEEITAKCPGTNICCSEDKTAEDCSDKGGEICTSSETCSGEEVDAENLGNNETCCLDSCETQPPELTECEENDGACRYSCKASESESTEYSCEDSEICCVEDESECSSDSDCAEGEKCEYGECVQKEERSYWWIWILVFLIVLVILGIIFKDKLKPYFNKIISKFKGGSSKGGSRRRPPGPPRGPPGRPSQPPSRPQRRPRRVMPPQQQRPKGKRPSPKKSGEMDDVLNKLKEMGK